MHELPSDQDGALTVPTSGWAGVLRPAGTHGGAAVPGQGTMLPVTSTPTSAPQAGDVLELTVGEVVHGGWCVSRQDDTGQAVFVRHALPGERVRATVTQSTARFARAEATEILEPSADRVAPPCRYAGPAGCGGCDWQHASLAAQRLLKAAVIRQQLRRIGGIDTTVVVEETGDDASGLGWRTVVTFAVGPDGVAGLRKHRSHEIVPIDRCLIAHDLVTSADVTGKRWPGARSVEVAVAPGTGEVGVLVTGRPAELPEVAADSVQTAGWSGRRTPVRGRGYLTQHAAGRDWRVSLGGFWQVHPAAAGRLAGDVLAALDPREGERALDLYCGAGLFAGTLAQAVGPAGSVLAVEQDATAAGDARRNLRAWPWARVRRGDAAAVLAMTDVSDRSLVVLDPPRVGVARPVIEALCTGPRRIAYVSCDPATLARDLRLLLDGGFELTALRGYDAFPMTHHVECLATLIRQ
jgi:tRNA/tmRNA/rRNA uracil-C5-methylase (TrmA/RlmC/RlmD family)